MTFTIRVILVVCITAPTISAIFIPTYHDSLNVYRRDDCGGVADALWGLVDYLINHHGSMVEPLSGFLKVTASDEQKVRKLGCQLYSK